MGILGAALLFFNGYFVPPSTYLDEVALNHGEVVVSSQGLIHGETLYTFVKNVDNQKPDAVRITSYSSEDYPKISDLRDDGNRIQYRGAHFPNGNERNWILAEGNYTVMEKMS